MFKIDLFYLSRETLSPPLFFQFLVMLLEKTQKKHSLKCSFV